MTIVENTLRSRKFRRERALLIDPRYLDSLADGSILWQLSGIGNVVDYHPPGNRLVFVARAAGQPAVETGEIAPSHSTSADLFSAGDVQTRVLRSAVRIVVFLCAASTTYASNRAHWQHHRTGGRITMTADATECFSIAVSARKDLSCSRISGIPLSRNGAFNAFPPLRSCRSICLDMK